MNKKNKANQTAQLSLLIATMVVIEVLSQTIFAAFVLLGIYFLIPNFYTAGGKTLMATIFTTNSIAEMIIAGLLTVSITPMLLRLKK